MNALNEVNKLIAGISYFPNRHSGMDHDSEEWLTSERMAVSGSLIFYPNKVFFFRVDS